MNKTLYNDINFVLEGIKVIDEQIELFNKEKTLFFQKQKIKKYEERIENFESTKLSLYKKYKC